MLTELGVCVLFLLDDIFKQENLKNQTEKLQCGPKKIVFIYLLKRSTLKKTYSPLKSGNFKIFLQIFSFSFLMVNMSQKRERQMSSVYSILVVFNNLYSVLGALHQFPIFFYILCNTGMESIAGPSLKAAEVLPSVVKFMNYVIRSHNGPCNLQSSCMLYLLCASHQLGT